MSRDPFEDYDPAIHGVSDGSGMLPLMIAIIVFIVWGLNYFFGNGGICG